MAHPMARQGRDEWSPALRGPSNTARTRDLAPGMRRRPLSVSGLGCRGSTRGELYTSSVQILPSRAMDIEQFLAEVESAYRDFGSKSTEMEASWRAAFP